jgi:multimeric flavodoxin WrbA
MRVIKAQVEEERDEGDVRILVVQGSPRSKETCPGEDGKSFQIVRHIVANAPEGVSVDVLDLSVGADGVIVQPCKGCVSTANGYHCHFPCDCYKKGDSVAPDLMHDKDVYERLMKCDAFMIVTPVNWYAASTSVKAFFDRLSCVNQTLHVDHVEELGIGKDPKISRAFEKSGKYDCLLKNHLEGKFAGFLAHGNAGGRDYNYDTVHECYSRNLPKSMTDFYSGEDPIEGKDDEPTEAILPLVWTCRYSGIEVPDDVIAGIHIHKNKNHATATDAMHSGDEDRDKVLALGRMVLKRLVGHVRKSRE